MENTQDEITLKELLLKVQDWWKQMWAKKWTFVIIGLIGGLAGLGLAFLKKPSYNATTTFVLESGDKGGGGLGAYASLAAMAGIDLAGGGGGIFQGDNILELYKSRQMIEKTLLTPVNGKSGELLIDRYIAAYKLRKAWNKKPRTAKLNFSHIDLSDRNSTKYDSTRILRDSMLGVFVKNINENILAVSKPDKKLSIIKVEVKFGDELFAKRFNEELVQNVNNFYVSTKLKKSKENVEILQRKTDSVRTVMRGEIYHAVSISDNTPNLNPTRQIQRAAPVQQAQFSAETNKAVLGELVKNLEMAKISLQKETPLVQVIDSPILPLKKDKLGKAMGIIIGGFLFGFLALCYFTGRMFLKSIFES
jgi:hypothetical protein